MAGAKAKIGLLLPTRGLLLEDGSAVDFDRILALAARAEEGGLDSVWVGDSLTAKPRMEPLATLAAVAVHTKRVRLGTAVLLAALRQPVLLAQTIGTVDLISNGRLIIGAGVGGSYNEDQRREWLAAGVPSSQRARRLEEIVQILGGLSSSEPFSLSGRHFNLDQVSVEPKPVQQGGVPILLASHWRAQQEAQMMRAARLGNGLISISDTPEEYAKLTQKVRAAMSELGRDSANFETAMYLTVNLGEDISKAEAEAGEFMMRYYGSNIWGSRWGPFGDPERVKARMAEYFEAGAQTLVVRIATFEPERQLETFLEKVAPAFL